MPVLWIVCGGPSCSSEISLADRCCGGLRPSYSSGDALPRKCAAGGLAGRMGAVNRRRFCPSGMVIVEGKRR